MKSIIATAGILLSTAAPALAGPYVNVESNSGWAGNNYTSTLTEFHVGYEGDFWYLQGGPAILAEDGEDAERRWSGKVGISHDVTESMNIYKELSAVTDSKSFSREDLGLSAKVGLKYTF